MQDSAGPRIHFLGSFPNQYISGAQTVNNISLSTIPPNRTSIAVHFQFRHLMPPRNRPVASENFHGSFDPGVTGRRTGVEPPLKVRRNSNGIESFSDYFASPRKDPSVSPVGTSNKRPLEDQQSKPIKPIPQRVRNDRPDLFHEIGERGRWVLESCITKTGISPPKNSVRDENGIEAFDDYLIKATEQTNKVIARERRKSIRRKSTSQALHNRKLSVATFVDDDDDDDQDEFIEESMSLLSPDTSGVQHQETRSSHLASGQSSRNHSDQRKSQSGLSDALDQSMRTPNDSDLIDFDVVPEGPIHSHSRQKSYDEQPMTVHDDEDEDDVQNSGGMVAHQSDDASVVSDGFDPQPAPPESLENGESNHPPGLEDIVEVEEEEEDSNTAALGGPADISNVSQAPPPKSRKYNPRPPPQAGVRRGNRQRCPRLDHWRGERVIYGRSTTPDGNQRVIGMLDVVRVPAEPPSSFAATRRNRRAGLQKIKSESVGPHESHSDHRAPEEGWDDKTRPNGIVYSYTKNKDCERAIVCTKKMVTLDVEDQAGQPNSFQFQRVVKDSDFIAGGLMYIPVGGGKPLKPAKDNFYAPCQCMSIAPLLLLLLPACFGFLVARNVYSIRNISQRTAKLTFAQARRATDGESEVDSNEVDEEHSILQSNINDPSTSTKLTKKNHPPETFTNGTNKGRKNNKKNPATRADASTSTTVPKTRKNAKKSAAKKKSRSKEKQKTAPQETEDQDEDEEQQPDEGDDEEARGGENNKDDKGSVEEDDEEEEEAQSSS
ncbi:hypothetical protein VP01_894g4 [Puccinia sorghi]|uniref:Mif2 N-terminal domain-containing protein n=1 Tax=Puccinia sorghi TaxID=27349 RepID=A0A0L6U8N6_9BASI|nr:hypothetical protein VP01_894g4 [Puccinia sorghi]